MVCGFICKCYPSSMVTHDGCQSFLHVSHIRQKLPKLDSFFCAMVIGHVLRLHCRQCNGWLFLVFLQNDSNANKKYEPRGRLLIVCTFHPICNAKSSQGNILAFKAYFKVQSAFQIPHNTFHGHPMQWTGLQHELTQRTHHNCNINPHG